VVAGSVENICKSLKVPIVRYGYIVRLNEPGAFKGRSSLSKPDPSRIRSKIFLAAMRKLIQICYGVIKNQTTYQPQIVLI
jgi:transposase